MNYDIRQIVYYQLVVHKYELINMRNPKLSKIICNRIQQLQVENNLNIEQLAYQSGISKGGLSEILRGMKEPSNSTIVKICIALNISMQEFFDFDEIKKYMENQF